MLLSDFLCLSRAKHQIRIEGSAKISQKLILCTSRTKYINPSQVRSTQHSYRRTNLLDLCKVVENYAPNKLKSVTILAGFNDQRSAPNVVTSSWKYLLNAIFENFNPGVPIIPKTIDFANNHLVKEKNFYVNRCPGSPLKPYLASFPVCSPGFHLNTLLFCKDGIQFSFVGSQASTNALSCLFPFFNHLIDQLYLIDMSSKTHCITCKRHLRGGGVWCTRGPGYLHVSCSGVRTGKGFNLFKKHLTKREDGKNAVVSRQSCTLWLVRVSVDALYIGKFYCARIQMFSLNVLVFDLLF